MNLLIKYLFVAFLVVSGLAVISGFRGPAFGQAGGVFQGGQKFVTIATASTNCGTIAIPGPHQLLELSLQNGAVGATVNNYLHLYDIASTPVAGALAGQIGVYAFPGSAANTGAGFGVNLGEFGASVSNGIGFCITLNPALADATNATVGPIVNWTVK